MTRRLCGTLWKERQNNDLYGTLYHRLGNIFGRITDRTWYRVRGEGSPRTLNTTTLYSPPSPHNDDVSCWSFNPGTPVKDLG